MTMVASPLFLWPMSIGWAAAQQSTSGANSAATFDGTADVIAWVGSALQDLTITDVAFLSGSVTSPPVVDVRIETVTNGRPSGTLYNSGTTNDCNATITPSGANTWQKVTLTGSASVSSGALFAIVIRYSSGTAGASNNFTVQVQSESVTGAPGFLPMSLQDTGGGTFSVLANQLCFMLSSSSAPVFVPGLWSFSSVSQTAYNSGTAGGSGPPPTGDEYAMKFTAPFKMRVCGVALNLSNIAAAADFRIFLWDNSGATNTESNALASSPVIDGDTTPSTTADGGAIFGFSAPYTLAAGSTYYIGVRAETANNIAIWTSSLAGTPPSNALGSSPNGSTMYLSARAWSAINPGTVGAWNDDQTRVPLFKLIVDQVDDGTGTVTVQMPVSGAMH